MRRRLIDNLPVFVVLAIVVALYGRLAEPGSAFVDRDISGLHLPMLVALAEAGRDGIPYWNPMIHGGQPLLTNPHYIAFYPPAWLVAVVPPHILIGWMILGHAILALIGVWRFCRHLGCQTAPAAFAAMGFVCGTAFCSTSNMLNLFLGLSWLPWVLLWGDRVLQQESPRTWSIDGAKLGLALAAQFLSGSPVTPILSGLALACLALETLPSHWRRIFRLVPIGIAGLGLAAVQLLPTLRHLSASTRTSGLKFETATYWSTPPARFIEMLWPRLFGDVSRSGLEYYIGHPGGEAWMLILSLYCGSLVMALATLSLARTPLARRRALLAMAAVGFFLSLGRYNPLYSSFLVHLPPFSIIRFPEKFFFLTTTTLPLLAALGWQRLLSMKAAERAKALRPALGLSAIAAIGAILVYLTPLIAPSLSMELIRGTAPDNIDWEIESGDQDGIPDEVLRARAGLLGRETFTSASIWVVTLLVLMAHGVPRIPNRWLGSLVLIALGLDLAYYGWRFNRPVPEEVVLRPPAALERFPPDSGRVFSDVMLFRGNVLYIPDPDSRIPSDLLRSFQRLDPYTGNLWGYAYALDPDPDLMLTASSRQALGTFFTESQLHRKGWSDLAQRLLGAWDVGIVVRRRSPEAQLEERRRTGRPPLPARLLPNRWRLPRYRLMSTVIHAPTHEAALAALRAVDFRLADTDAVVEESADGTVRKEHLNRPGRILSVTETSSRIVIEYEAETPTFLVAAVTWDRDWSAAVAGSEPPVLPTALGQMGIALPAGRHELELEYRNPIVVWGALVSGLFITACLIVLRPLRRRNSGA